MKEYRGKLPYPPSVNSLWRMGKGNWYSSQKAKAYKTVVWEALILAKAPKFTQYERLSLTLWLYPPDRRKRDIDNPCKVLMDSLQYAGLFKDDSQIKELHLSMCEPVPRGQEGYVVICVRSLDVVG